MKEREKRRRHRETERGLNTYPPMREVGACASSHIATMPKNTRADPLAQIGIMMVYDDNRTAPGMIALRPKKKKEK